MNKKQNEAELVAKIEKAMNNKAKQSDKKTVSQTNGSSVTDILAKLRELKARKKSRFVNGRLEELDMIQLEDYIDNVIGDDRQFDESERMAMANAMRSAIQWAQKHCYEPDEIEKRRKLRLKKEAERKHKDLELMRKRAEEQMNPQLQVLAKNGKWVYTSNKG